MNFRVLLSTAVLASSVALAQGWVDKNVPYGMYSGLALLMDVHHPTNPNGMGLIVVPGSGWNSSQAYDAQPLTALRSSIRFFVPKLLDAGYTLFVVNHRNGPRFHYPAAVEDVERAVRYVRYNAKTYGIDPNQMGAVGYSSGAHLVAMLGVLDGKGEAQDPDPVNRASARVQCVVAAATPTDLEHFDAGAGIPNVALFMGQIRPRTGSEPDPVAVSAYREASPIVHVSASAAPLLLLHGDADQVVPFHQAETMLEVMKKAGGDVKLIRLAGGGHGFAGETAQHPDWPDFFAESVQWLDRHLKSGASTATSHK
jgi:acetyl esterase/lipase